MNNLEIIGLAFSAGVSTGLALDDLAEGKHERKESKEISSNEFAEILENLAKKARGEE